MKKYLLLLVLLIPLISIVETSALENESTTSKFIELSVPIIENDTLNLTNEELSPIDQDKEKSSLENKNNKIIFLIAIVLLLVVYNVWSIKHLIKLRNKIKKKAKDN